MRLRIEPPARPLPVLRWKWDEETDILAGAFAAPPEARGLTAAMEITDQAGTVLVCDVTRGLFCGLDVVVWPDVEVDPAVRLPEPVPEGSLGVTMDEEDGAPSVEVDGTIVVRASVDESLFHIRLGEAIAVRRLRLADRLCVDLDAAGHLAGFWLVGVPPYVPPDDDDF